MIDFMKIAKDSYVVYVNGCRVTEVPLTKEELKEKVANLKLTDEDVLFVDKFYNGGEKQT